MRNNRSTADGYGSLSLIERPVAMAKVTNYEGLTPLASATVSVSISRQARILNHSVRNRVGPNEVFVDFNRTVCCASSQAIMENGELYRAVCIQRHEQAELWTKDAKGMPL